MDVFNLSRNWFNFCFENPEKIKPNHTALYFFCIEHCNRLGWKEKFGLPTGMAKEAIGIHSYKTYITTLHELIDWGFIKLIDKSKNQYSSNIITLVHFDKKRDQSLDKAMIKHGICSGKKGESTYQSIGESTYQSTGESIDSIDIPINIKPKTNKPQENYTYNLFYDFELQNSMGDEMYKEVVDYLFGRHKENNIPLAHVLKIEKQLTYEQFLKLKEKISTKVPDFRISRTLSKMNNNTKYTKNRVLLYECINTWIDNAIEYKKQGGKGVH